jgi:AcrR family transcriptional regulator
MATAKSTGRRRDTADTRARLLEATRSLLVSKGFAETTTRAIAAEADCNQGLISYHFGGLNPLLLAVLDASSGARLEAYRTTLETAHGLRAIRTAARTLYRGDRESGHVRILAELMTGGLMDRDLGREVATRIQPWLDVAELAVRQAIPAVARRRAPVGEIAYAIVAMFIGVEILGAISGDADRGLRVVDRLSTRFLRGGSDDSGVVP